MDRTTRARRLLGLVVVPLLLVVGAACSGSTSDNFDDVGSDLSSADGDRGSSDGDGGVAAGTGSPTDVADVELVASTGDRRIIYDGEVHAIVDDLGASARAAVDAIEAEGGFVFGEETTDTWAHLVFKVPADAFDDAFDSVVTIGDVTSQVREAEDVTEQFVDIESRMRTMETSIGRLQGFLEQATDVGQVTTLEAELTRREAELESLAGRLRVLRDQTELATLTVSYGLDEAAVTEAAESDRPPGFREGFGAGWDAIAVVLVGLATVAGFALPFAPFLGVAAGALWWLRRRRSAADVSGDA